MTIVIVHFVNLSRPIKQITAYNPYNYTQTVPSWHFSRFSATADT